MTTSAWLGAAFLLVGLAAASLMMWLWGFPRDEETGKSTAPRWLSWVHRGLGYCFIVLYAVLMTSMIPRLWLYSEELGARSTIHAFLGVGIGAVLLVKVLIVRFFPAFRGALPIFGITLVVLSISALALPLATAARSGWLGREASSPATRDRVLADVSRLEGAPSMLSLAAGREAFHARCLQCHDQRRVLAAPRTTAEWRRTVARMASKPFAAGHAPISARQEWEITGYVSVLAGMEEAAATPVDPALPASLGGTPSAEPVTPAVPAPVAGGLASSEVQEGPAEGAGAGATAALAAAILARDCAVCHAGPRAPKGLLLDSIEAAARSNAVLAGRPAESELIRRVKGESQPRMPMGGPPWLSDAEVAVLEEWIASLGGGGAAAAPPGPAPRDSTAVPPSPVTAPAATPAPSPTPPALPGPGEPVLFTHVRPVLLQNCVRCHTPQGQMGPAPEGLLLSSWQDALQSAERPVIIPGNPAASLLLRHVRGLESPRMPFDGPPWLDGEQVALIERWIREGARDEAGRPAPVPAGREVRLRGVLERQWILEGAGFRVGPGTEVRDARVGGVVELRAVVEPDGGLRAERVRGR